MGPLVEECSAEQWRSPLLREGVGGSVDDACAETPLCGAVVALGKFDAMHVGHRTLALRAARMGGHPFLLAFSGMAEILKWPSRLPLVAPCDRPRVLRSWTAHCDGLCPRQRIIPFNEIRHLAPEEFVAVLAKELGAVGVVAGSNYRFGYRAKGDAEMLQALGQKYGLRVSIAELVGTSGEAAATLQQVSSSKIRELLAAGEMGQVQEYLARPYRLVCQLDGSGAAGGGEVLNQAGSAFIPQNLFLNQPPGTGTYEGVVCESMSFCGDGTVSSPCDEDCPVSFQQPHPQQQQQQLVEVHVSAAGISVPASCLQALQGASGLPRCIVVDFGPRRTAGGAA